MIFRYFIGDGFCMMANFDIDSPRVECWQIFKFGQAKIVIYFV